MLDTIIKICLRTASLCLPLALIGYFLESLIVLHLCVGGFIGLVSVILIILAFQITKDD